MFAPKAGLSHATPATKRPIGAAPVLRRQPGNQARLRALARPAPQTPLAIGAANGPLEHDADRIADQVMRASATDAPLRRACAECEDEKLHKKSAGPATPAVAPPIVHQALRSPGQPLDAPTRAFMEPRFGQDLSGVRIHTDTLASQSADAVAARAYTVGQHIVFRGDQYAPSSESGRHLLAHELAHVAQNGPDLARAPAAGHCGGAWTCVATPCTQPDVAGDGTASTTWSLDLNIDTDVEKSTDITTPDDVGHTSLRFSESNGTQYTFGFYPRPGMPASDWVSMVPGCVVHPDTNHNACFDYTEHYQLSQEQYSAALSFAQANCVVTPKYKLFDYNCTTFAVDVAKRAGQSPPSPKGPVAAGTKNADNPNSLKDGYLDRHIPTRNLTGDTEIRDWVAAHTGSDIGALPIGEKLRLLNRLLDGYVSDDDVVAFETICATVDNTTDQHQLQNQLGPREKELNQSQGARIHKALFIVLDPQPKTPGAATG